jgi:hydrogenase expression/formation protein HypC
MCLGIPGSIMEITDTVNKLGVVDVCGVRRQINLACIVDDTHPIAECVGEWVLVHVGFAMSRINQEEARLTLEVLQQLGEAQTELASIRAAQTHDRWSTALEDG